MSTLIGTLLGSYEIQALLGSGGMASVYRALDRTLQRPVAIKILTPSLAADPDFVQRFQREAQILATLHHAHVVTIYSFGEEQGQVFMVQELLPGPTLAQQNDTLRAKNMHMPSNEVVQIVGDLAAALDAIHAIGIIHRDVKPANAIYNAQHQIVLTDFGISRAPAHPSQTAIGSFVGTPAYMAPEQATGGTLTPATDIYALAVLTFELLTGKLPFDSDTGAGLIVQHVHSPPPALSQLRPDLPRTVESVLQRGLAKEPHMRYAQAGLFARELEQALSGTAISVHQMQTVVAPVIPAPTLSGPQQPTLAQPAAQAVAMPAFPQAASAAPMPTQHQQQKKSRLGPLVLGLSLIALLALGLYFAAGWFRSADQSDPAATVLPVLTEEASAEPTLAPSSEPEPTVQEAEPAATMILSTPLPSLVPLPTIALPGDIPPAPATVSLPELPQQPGVPPIPGAENDPIEQLRSLVRAGIEDGRAGSMAQELGQRLAILEQALAAQDTKEADKQLRDMRSSLQKTIGKKRDLAAIDPVYAAQLLALIDQALKS